jgi:hypothetical protein
MRSDGEKGGDLRIFTSQNIRTTPTVFEDRLRLCW